MGNWGKLGRAGSSLASQASLCYMLLIPFQAEKVAGTWGITSYIVL